MSPRIDPIEKLRKDPAELHRKSVLATFDETAGQRTFSIVAGIADGDKEAPVLLSLDDSITEILERIKNKFRLQRTPNVRVVMRTFNREEQDTAQLTEHNFEETLRNLWRRRVQALNMILVEVDEAPLRGGGIPEWELSKGVEPTYTMHRVPIE